VARAEELLDRLWRASGQGLALPPRLVVLDRERPGLLALALPDRSVLISRAGLELCLNGGRPGAPGPARAVEARLGLVLAHELDHILRLDDWHVAAFAADSLGGGVRDLAEGRDVHVLAELRADDSAVLLLAAAGIDVRPALQPDGFLERWAGAGPGGTQGTPADTHPEMRRRMELMRRRLERLAAHAGLFREGVVHLRAGRYREAIEAFDTFGRRAPYSGKDLLNNSGLAHYQLALRAFGGCDAAEALRFRLFTQVEEDPLFLAGQTRGAAGRCRALPEVKEELASAVKALLAAVAADPRYLPARLNLIAALVLGGKTDEAKAFVQAEETLELARSLAKPGEEPVAVRLAMAICDYLRRRGLRAPVDGVIADLRRLAREHPADAAVAYDLARVLQESGESAAAREAWTRYLQLAPAGPYAAAAREALQALGASFP
jgi:tetratricopeptide (TPR) repeat protein